MLSFRRLMLESGKIVVEQALNIDILLYAVILYKYKCLNRCSESIFIA